MTRVTRLVVGSAVAAAVPLNMRRMMCAPARAVPRAALPAVIACTMAAPAWAVLLPQEYVKLKHAAPLAFAGVVEDDPGGHARVRVSAVDRGGMAVGSVVTVVYPEFRGQTIPAGGDIWYRRFAPGDVLKVWGQRTADTVTIVPGGIEDSRKGPPPPPLNRARSWAFLAAPVAVAAALAGVWAWRRRRAI